MKVNGIVGDIRQRFVTGWAFDEEIDKPIQLDLYLNNKLIQSTEASINRPDLVKLGIHDKGNCGFQFKLDNRTIRDAKKVKVKYLEKEIPFSRVLKAKVSRSIILKKQKEVQEKKFFFIHIPKTAGTSFKRMLESVFQENKIIPSKSDVIKFNGLYPQLKQLTDFEANRFTNADILIGHYPMIAGRLLGENIEYLTFLRNPVDRAVSNIFHMKRNDPRYTDYTPEQIYNTGHWSYQNLQVRYLCDRTDGISMRFTASHKLAKPAVKLAIENLNNIQFVGITEHFNASIQLLEKLYGWKLGKSLQLNTSGKKYQVSNALLEKIKRDNALEFELYEAAVIYFKKLLKQNNIEL